MGRGARRGRATDGVAQSGQGGRTPLGLIGALGALLLATLPAAGAELSPWDWKLPPGFPVPVVPPNNPMSAAKVDLGRRLFFEPSLSSDGKIACASCHQPLRAYTDDQPRPRGVRGDLLAHNAPSLSNVVYGPAYGWADNRVTRLEDQMLTPLLGVHPVEMGLKGRELQVLALLAADPDYASAFAAAFPEDPSAISVTNLSRAIASFERTLISGRSGFDRYVFDDDRTAMSEAARRGMQLFYSKRAHCGDCHSGITFSGSVRAVGQEAAQARFANTGVAAGDRGLEESTGRVQDRGKFKVPGLRNVALTAPYMHDGSIATLHGVIDFYDRGGGQRRLQPLALNAREKGDLLAFLASLTDPQFVTASAP